MRSRMIAIPTMVGLALLTAVVAEPQEAPAGLQSGLAVSSVEFELVAIHPERSSGSSHYVKIAFEGNGFIAHGATLGLLLQSAFGLHDDRQIVGMPKWAQSESFSIEARFDSRLAPALSGMRADQLLLVHQHMLQKLFVNRFNLSSHVEPKVLPILSLTVVKGGTKLHESAPDDAYLSGEKWPSGVPVGPHFVSYSFGAGHVRITGQGASLDQLVNRITEKAYWLGLDHILVNSTNLPGRYDFSLEFTVPWPPGSTVAAEADGAPDMLTAFRDQLGLKVQEEKGPVDALVIDHIDMPSEN